jgi:hypothetical protein
VSRSKRKFSLPEYEESHEDYLRGWKTLDEVLYRLCRVHPNHIDPGANNAKIYIIGRTYTTGIERKIPTTGAQSSSMSQVSDLFLKHHENIDRWFARVATVSEPLTGLGIRKILLYHGLLVNCLSTITRDKQSSRSFASKYLHFHNPAVPIYDSIAASCLSSLVPLRTLRDFQIRSVKGADPEYADYVRRFAKLYRSIVGPTVSVRRLDYYLIWKVDSDRAKEGNLLPGP